MNIQKIPPPLPKSRAASHSKKSGQAMAALILTCIGIFIFPLLIVGIILGHVALSKIKLDSEIGGKGLARTALIIGYSYIALIFICVMLFLFVPVG
jgi:hypothetical protein